MANPQKETKPIELCFPEKQITDEMMDSWLDADLNALLIGKHGTGKTARVLSRFNAKFGKKWAYFSGATLDPWIHVVGVPNPSPKLDAEGKQIIGSNGQPEQILNFILPESLQDDVEAIFIDEWNRMHKVAKSALMELQQFKSINGRRFPNLRVVWGAINPPNEDEGSANFYTVEPSDPAQLDRFQVIVRIPFGPYAPHFKQTFGHNGEVICKWWKQQPEAAREILTPRRLEYILKAHKAGVDIRFLCPENVQLTDLLRDLAVDEDQQNFFLFRDNPSDGTFSALIQNAEDWDKHKEALVKGNFWNYFCNLDEEIFCRECEEDTKFAATTMALASKGLFGFKEIFDGLGDSNLAQKWKTVERNMKSIAPENLFENPLIMASHTLEEGLPDSFREDPYGKYCNEGGAGWKGAAGGDKTKFLNQILLKRRDINWADKDTQQCVVGFLISLLNLLTSKTLLEESFLKPIRTVLMTLTFNGVDRKVDERFDDLLTKLEKKLGYSPLGEVDGTLRGRAASQIEKTLTE